MTNVSPQTKINKIVSLCKRRGYVFQSSEIYGGLKSSYDFGHLGVELKRNIADLWWQDLVHRRDDMVGFDAAIIMHPKVWQASGHLDGFSDPLVDCLDCKQRFRADKAPRHPAGATITYQVKNMEVEGKVAACGYVCPYCSSPRLGDERQFNLMFQTNLGAVNPVQDLLNAISSDDTLTLATIRQRLRKINKGSAVYLRPETAQAMFVQFMNVLQTTSKKPPFGIAQIGKSFRNEIVTEHFIFRACEFEQMEIEYFVPPDSWRKWLDYWCEQRLNWYRGFVNQPDNFRLRQHEEDELAHYAQACYDIDFKFPWGWDELEGIASRGDYDLNCHQRLSQTKLSYFDNQAGKRYLPYVIEPSAGLTRCVLAVLLDAYEESKGIDSHGREKTRVLLKLSPRLAPIKAAFLPLVKDEGQIKLARHLADSCRQQGVHVAYDDNQSIGKRYAKHDEIGTPFAITVDTQSCQDGLVTVRDRDTTTQTRMAGEAAVAKVVSCSSNLR
ncbi:MAG: glycine--tRNA ligase [Pseudomonadota bacterium]|nr:glycine--tRNA ligase [Pseudomonadota bacterium]